MKIKLRRSIVFVLAFFFAFSGEAKLKGLPFMKSYKDYSISKKNVKSVKYTVYSPQVDGAKEITNSLDGQKFKGEISDYIVEIFFDDNGNRNKEIVYHIETGAVEISSTWNYNEKDGTMILTRTDGKGELIIRQEFVVNYKAGTVLIRSYQNLVDPNTFQIVPNVLVYEELWTENTKNKKASHKKAVFSFADGSVSDMTLREYNLEKPYAMYHLMEDNSSFVDYTWIPNYSSALFKASNSKMKKENIFDGTRYEYSAKKKLLSSVLKYSKEGNLIGKSDYSYSYDKNKNWVQAIQKEFDKLFYIVLKDIEYR